MKKTIILILLLIPMTIAQVPSDVSTGTAQKIQQEHQNTRKFVSDEITRQRNEFFNEMDDRATYYENTVNNMLTDTVWKLGLIIGGTWLIISSVQGILKMKLEKRRYRKMEDMILARSNKRQNTLPPPPKPAPEQMQTQPPHQVPNAPTFKKPHNPYKSTGIDTPAPAQVPPRKLNKISKELTRNEQMMVKLKREYQLLMRQQDALKQQIGE